MLDRTTPILMGENPVSPELNQPIPVSIRKSGDADDRDVRVEGQVREAENGRGQLAQPHTELVSTTPSARVDQIKRQAERVNQNAPKAEIFELSALNIEEDADSRNKAQQSMAGTRVRSELKDLGETINVVTNEFFRDTGASDAPELLKFTT
jgi:outer membrane receptor for monomeric catechols